LFYSIARGKLLPYILPCFPPLALLLAAGLREAIANANGAYIKQGLRGLMILWGALLVALLLNRFAGVGTPFFDGTENIRWGTLFAAIATGLVLGLLALRNGGRDLQILATGLAVVPLLLAIQFVIPNSTRQSKMPGAALTAMAAQIPPDAVLISDGRYVHALAWIFKRNDIYLLNSGELTYGLSYPEDRLRLLTADSLRQLVEGVAGKRAVFIACDESFDPMLNAALPDTARRISSGSMIVWQTVVAR
jgi:4-amino-4-deoxy-L-arabinose transferase